MYLAKFREAFPALPARHTSPHSQLGIIARALQKLAKWVGAARAPRGSQWYDSDGAHRGM